MDSFSWNDLVKTAEDAVKAVPPGKYPVTITEADASKPSSTGKPMIKIKIGINSGDMTGRTLSTQFTVSPESGFALHMFFSALSAFGLDLAWLNANTGGMSPEQQVSVIAANLVGKTATAVVTIQKDGQFKGRNQVNTFESSGAAGSLPGGVPMPTMGVAPAGPPSVPMLSVKPPAVPSGLPSALQPPTVAVVPTPSF